MRLASVLTPMSDENLRLAVQCGVTDIVDRYPGPTLEDVLKVKVRVESFGLRLAAIEGYVPMENLIFGCDDGTELAAMKNLVRHLGESGVPILCYNFMAGTDWVRTKLDVAERGGATVTEFNLAEAEQAMSLSDDTTEIGDEAIDAAALWHHLEFFLAELLPVAEEAGVDLAMHPDDPPLPSFRGKARIMNSVENFERLIALSDSSRNGICFCQANFVAMGADIPDAIRRLGPRIRYVHFRDVEGMVDNFRETFHDNGPTDMVAAMRAYREVDFDGPIRPDHVPQFAGEKGEPGYTMQGRLFAYGYIRALLQATGN